MKVAVIVPSADYETYAGTRIRYRRLIPELSRNGVALELEDIARFDPAKSDCQVVLFSKCHEPQSLVLAAMASDAGKLVGVDLFDDYFSQREDSRLARYRVWLTQILFSCDFVLGSTQAMVKVVRNYGCDLPVHVLNDPAPRYDGQELSAILRHKAEEARRLGHIRVAWFGVGDNPYFRVGLEDLATFAHVLNELTQTGMTVELELLTNRRALNAKGLALIRRLPVLCRATEWTEDAERKALERAVLAFLPVNAQPFSAAKSLNRAVTALCAGCQLLSVGFPLYEALDSIIYRDAAAFLRDLATGRMRSTPDRLIEKLEILANPLAEAERLASFLRNLLPSRAEALPIMLIHGRSTRAEAHRQIHAAGGLSVASPYCSAPFAFDAVFRFGSPELQLLVTRKASMRLSEDLRSALVPALRIGGERFFRLRSSHRSSPLLADPLPYEFAAYARVMDEIRNRLPRLFGPCRMIVSEMDRLPLWPAPRKN